MWNQLQKMQLTRDSDSKKIERRLYSHVVAVRRHSRRSSTKVVPSELTLSKVLHPHSSMVGVHPHKARNSIGCTDGLHGKVLQPPEPRESSDCEDMSVESSQVKSKLAGPKAAPLGRKQKQFRICRSSILQCENYKIPLH